MDSGASTPKRTPSKRMAVPAPSSSMKTDSKRIKGPTTQSKVVNASVTSAVLQKALQFDAGEPSPYVDTTESMRTVAIVRPLMGNEQMDPRLALFPDRQRAVVTGDRGATSEFTFGQLVECHLGGSEIEALYEDHLQDFCRKSLEGFTTVVVAYGQTGSGKTTCMGTGRGADHVSRGECGAQRGRGIAQHVIKTVYEKVQEGDLVEMCGVELTTAGFKDLVDPSNPTEVNVRVVDLLTRRFDLVGQRWESVPTAEDAGRILSRVTQARETADNGFHTRSSRTHLIIMFRMRTHGEVEEVQGGESVRVQKIMTGNVVLMDLAGSEEPPRDVSLEQKKDKRFQEGVEINKSLTALRSYVDELIDKQSSTNRPSSRRLHDLNFFIDSLMERGGCFTLIGCASPAAEHHEETKNTLKFTSTAKAVTSRPIKMMEETEAERLKRLVRQLTAEANHWKNQFDVLQNSGRTKEEALALERRTEELERDMAQLQKAHLEILQRKNPFVSPTAKDRPANHNGDYLGGMDEESLKKVARARQYVKELRTLAGSAADVEAFFVPPRAGSGEDEAGVAATEALMLWAQQALHHVVAKPFVWQVEAFLNPEGEGAADPDAPMRVEGEGEDLWSLAEPKELKMQDDEFPVFMDSCSNPLFDSSTPAQTPREGMGGQRTPRTAQKTHSATGVVPPFSVDAKSLLQETRTMELRSDAALQGILSLARDEQAAAALQVLMETATKLMFDNMEKRDAALATFNEQRALIEEQSREIENLRSDIELAAIRLTESTVARETASKRLIELEDLSAFQQLEVNSMRDQIAALQEQLAEFASTRRALEEKENALCIESSRVQIEIAQATELRTQLAEREAEAVSLRAAVGEREAALAALRSEAEAARAAAGEAGALRAEVAALNERIAGLEQEVEEAATALCTANGKVEALTGALESAAAATTASQEQISALSQELATLQASGDGAMLQLQSTLTALNEEKGAVEQKLTALESSLSSLQEEKAALESQLGGKADQLTEARAHLATAQEALAGKQQEAEALHASLATLQGQAAALEAQLSERAVQVAELEGRLASTVAESSAARDAAAQRQGEVEALTARLAAQEERAASLEAQLTLALEQATTKQAELEAASSRLAAATAQAESLSAELASAAAAREAAKEEASGLRAAVTATEERAAATAAELQSVTAKLQEAEVRAAEVQVQLEQASSSAAASEGKTEALTAELSAKQQEVVELRASLSSLQEEKAALESQLGGKADQLTEAQTHLATAQEALAAKQQEAEALQEKVTALKQEAEAASAAIAAATAAQAKLQEELAAKEGRVSELEASERAAREELATVNGQFATLRHQKDCLENAEGALKEQIVQLMRDVESLTAKLTEGAQSSEEAASLRAAVGEREAALAALRSEAEAARAAAGEAGDLRAEVEALNERIAGLEQEKAAAHGKEAEVAALTAQLQERCSELTSARQALGEAQNEAARLREQLESRGDELSALQLQEASLRSSVRDLKASLESKHKQVEMLQQELQGANARLEDLGGSHTARVQILTLENRSLLDTQRSLKAHIADAERRIEEVLQQIDAVTADKAQAEGRVKATEEEVRALTARVAELSDVQQRFFALEGETASLRGDYEKATTERDQLLIEIAAFKGEVDALKGRASLSREDLDLNSSRLTGLESVCKALEVANETLAAKNQALEEQLSKLQQSAASETESLRLQLSSLQMRSPTGGNGGAAASTSIKELQSMAEQLSKARDEAAAVSSQLEEARFQQETAEHALKSARAENKKLEQRLFHVQSEAAEREAALQARVSELEAKLVGLGDVSRALEGLKVQCLSHEAEVARIAADKRSLILELEAAQQRLGTLEGQLTIAQTTSEQAEERYRALSVRYEAMVAEEAKAVERKLASPLFHAMHGPRSPKTLLTSHTLQMEEEEEGQPGAGGERAGRPALIRSISFGPEAKAAAAAVAAEMTPVKEAKEEEEDEEGEEIRIIPDSPDTSDEEAALTPRLLDCAPTPATAAARRLTEDATHVATRKRRKTRGFSPSELLAAQEAEMGEDAMEVTERTFSFGVGHLGEVKAEEDGTTSAVAAADAEVYDYQGGHVAPEEDEMMAVDEEAKPAAKEEEEEATERAQSGDAAGAANPSGPANERNALRQRILEAQRQRKELQERAQRALQLQKEAATVTVPQEGERTSSPAPENEPPASMGPTPANKAGKRKLGKRNWAVGEKDTELALAMTDKANAAAVRLAAGVTSKTSMEDLAKLKSSVNPRR